MRLAAKKDEHQNEIVGVLRDLGFTVADTSRVGFGFPDIVIARANRVYLCEIKTNRNKGIKIGWKLRPSQKKFRDRWNADILVFDSVESVLRWEKMLSNNIPIMNLKNIKFDSVIVR